MHISHSCSAEWLINVQDAHCQFISELAGEIADEEDNDADDEELELETEAPPPPPPVEDVDVGYITVDADLEAADAVDAVEAADVAEDEAWRAAREACLVRDNGGLELELELENMKLLGKSVIEGVEAADCAEDEAWWAAREVA